MERYEQFAVRLISARNMETDEIVPIVGDSNPKFAPRVAVFLEDNEPTAYRLALSRTTFTEGERFTFAIEQVGTPRQRIEYQVVGYGDNPVLASDLSGTVSDALLADGFVLFSGVERDAVIALTARDNDVGELNKQLQIQVVEDTATVGPLLATAVATLQDNDPGVIFDVTDELVVGERDGTAQIDLRLIGVVDLASYASRAVRLSATLMSGVADRVRFSGTDLTGVNTGEIAVITTAAIFGVNGIATLELDLFDNDLYENDAVFELIIESLEVDDSGTVIIYSAGQEPRRTIRVVSDDLPLQFQIPTESFSETDTVAPLRITVAGTRETVGQTITVALLAVDGTTEPEDYNLPATAELVAGGDGEINLEIVNDELYEISEELTVYVISATLNGVTTVFAEADRPSMLVEITDDDNDQPRIRFVPNRVFASEGTRLQDLRVELINADADGSPSILQPFVQDSGTGTAQDKIDYDIRSDNLLSIPDPNGQTFAELDIDILRDRIDDEDDETIILVVSFEGTRVDTLTIIIQDVVPFELNFDQRRLTEDGDTVTGTLDFSTSTIGATRSTETVSFVLDGMAERVGDYRVVTSDLVTATILPSGATAFTVTVPAGSATAEFTIEAVDDLVYEEDEPLVLSGLGFSDGIIFSGTVEFKSTTVDFTIVDNEVAVVTLPQSLIQVSEAMITGVELPIEVNFATLDTLTVELSVTDDTAERNTHFRLPTTFEIPRGGTGTLITIVPIDDELISSNRSFTVQLKSASYLSSTALVEVDSQAETIVEILEDDTFNVVTLTIPDLDLIGRPELGQGDDARATVDIQLELGEQLEGEVRVRVEVDHISTIDDDLILGRPGDDLVPDIDRQNAGELVFAARQTRTVTTLSIEDDSDPEFDQESYRLVFTVLEHPDRVIIDPVGMLIQTGTILPEMADPIVRLTLPLLPISEPEIETSTTTIIGIEWTNPPRGSNNTFGVRTRDIETTRGKDYQTLDEVLNLVERDGATGQVRLVILDDDINELTETLLIEVYQPSDPNRVYASGTVTISETFDPAELSFGATTAIVREGKTVELPIAINNIGSAGLAEDVRLDVELNYNGIPEEKIVAQTSITVPQGTVTGTYSFSVARDGLLGESGTVTVQIRSASGLRTGEAHLIADPLTAAVTVIKPPTASLVEVPPLNEGAQQEITVTTSEALDYDVTIGLDTDPASTAIVGRDYAALTPSVTIPAGATSGTFTLEALNDDLYEQRDETVTLILLLDGHADLDRGARTTLDVTIRNTNPTPTVSIVGVQPLDEGTTGEFQIVLDGKLDVALRVDISIVTSTAELGMDYDLPLTSFEIPAEKLTATAMFELIALEDTVMPPEPDEFVDLALSVPADSPVMTAAVTRITIRNVEVIPPVVSLAAPASVREGDTAQIEISLDRDTNADVILNLEVKVESSTAVLNADYKPLTSTVTIAAGQTVATISLETIPDDIYERNEQITLALTISRGIATLGTGAERVIIITDDETQPTLSLDAIPQITEGDEAQITARLDGVLDVTLTLSLLVSDAVSSATTDDYTLSETSFEIPAGDTTATITLVANDNIYYEGDETLVLELSTVSDLPALGAITQTVTIADSNPTPTISFDPAQVALSVQEGQQVRVKVIDLNGAPTAVGETVTLRVLGGTATEGVDFAPIDRTVKIDPSYPDTTISINTIFDPTNDLYEGAETILLELVSSSGLAQIGQPQRKEITIIENSRVPTIALQTPPATVNESSTIELLATIPAPVGVTITVSIAIDQLRGTAIEGEDFAFVSQSARIEVGDVTATFTLDITHDTLFEDTETIVLRLTGATAGVTHDTTEYTLSITDDDSDSIPPISFDPVPDVNEGESVTVTVRLGSAVGVDLEVSLAVDPSGSSATLTPAEYALPTSVTILAGDTTATITLTTTDDLNEEPLRELLLLQATAVDGVPTDEAQRPAVTIAIIDNERPTNVTVPALTGMEGQTVTAEIVLNNAHNSDVNLRLEASADYLSDVNPDVTNFTIAAGVTSAIVEIYLVPDNIREGDETVEYILSSPDASALGVGETRSLVITVSDQPNLAEVTLSIDPETVTEGPDVTVLITATLDMLLPTGLTVSLTYDPTSSAEPDDFSSTLEILIPAGELSSSVVLTITDDSFAEFTEELRLDVSTSQPLVGVNPATVIITIQDDVANDQTPTLSFESPNLELKEGQRGRKLKAILTGGVLGEDLTINLRRTTFTAIEGTDYVLAEPTITIPAGGTTGAVEFIAYEDGIYEFVEEVIYELITPSTARVALGDTISTRVAIVDLQEPPTVSLDTPASITEGSTGIVTVRLDGEYGFPLRLTLLASRITASVSSYRILTPTLEIAPGDTETEFEIEAIDDDLYEEDEDFNLNLRVLGDNSLLFELEPALITATKTRVVTIVDDQPKPTVSLLAITDVSEGATATIIAELTGKLAVPVVLELTATGGSAVQFTDYLLATPTLEIAAGDLMAEFEINALADGVTDGIKTVELVLTVSGSVVDVVDGIQTLTILDADALRPTLTLDTVAPIDEGTSRVVTARLTKELSTILTITVVTTLASDPTSTADRLDYSLSATTLEIPANSLDVTFTITINDDDLYEGDEQFILSLRPVGDQVDLGTVTRTVTIRDNDHLPSLPTLSLDEVGPLSESPSAAILTLRLSTAIKFTTTVSLSVVGGDADMLDYSLLQPSVEIGAGELTATAELRVLDDDLYEGPETLRLRLTGTNAIVSFVPSEQTIQLVDADPIPSASLESIVPVTEAGGLSAVVTLTVPANFTITVSLNHRAASTADVTDYRIEPSSVDILAGQTTVAVSFYANADDLYELTETVQLDLRAFRDGTSLLSEATAAITIVDKTPPPSVSFGVLEPLVDINEGDMFNIELVLTGAASTVDLVVPFDITGTAVVGTDYTLSPLSVTFAAGSTTALITLDTIDDLIDEDTETIVLDLGQVVNGPSIGSPSQITIMIADNDLPTPEATLSLETLPLTENETGTLEIVLTAAAAVDVTFTLEYLSGTADGADYRLTPNRCVDTCRGGQGHGVDFRRGR